MKRIVFCFDGTWNRIDSAYFTNVVITAESILPLTKNGIAQLIYYDDGVGTNNFELIRGGLFGTGLVQNLAEAYRFLIFNYTPGDEIFVFGFSRGAYTARSFAGLLSNCGIMRRSYAGKVAEAIGKYRSRSDTDESKQSMYCFRQNYSPDICVSEAEDAWRAKNVPGYKPSQLPRLHLRYLGVWDTVGALGIPSRFRWLAWINKKHQFHDTNLSPFVDSARHAIAIDERRTDFAPTLWTNLQDLNKSVNPEDYDPPYQQKWFPGTHCSVGGGDERRGLSDQAMDWVLDGARKAGLEIDDGEGSRIFELKPNYLEHLESSTKPGLLYRLMKKVSSSDRLSGPSQLSDVSVSALRRWCAKENELEDRQLYRPLTLKNVDIQLKAYAKAQEKFNAAPILEGKSAYSVYQVKRGDQLGKIAKDLLGSAKKAAIIFAANRDKIDNMDRIYVGQVLKIPRD